MINKPPLFQMRPNIPDPPLHKCDGLVQKKQRKPNKNAPKTV